MKLQKVNAKQTACLLNRLVETSESQVSLYQVCEANTPIVFVRFAVSTVSHPDRKSNNTTKIGELHIVSRKKLTRPIAKSVVDCFLDQVDTLFYYDSSLGWEQFDGRLKKGES
jgi:hypothetical protein